MQIIVILTSFHHKQEDILWILIYILNSMDSILRQKWETDVNLFRSYTTNSNNPTSIMKM